MSQNCSGPGGPRSSMQLLLQELLSNRQMLLCDAMRILGSLDRAEDVLQEAALRCLSRPGTEDELRRPPQFARRMIRNLSIDRLRRDRALLTLDLPEPEDSRSNVEQGLIARQTLGAVDGVLDSFVSRDREIFLRHQLMGEKQKTLAREFSLSPARVNAVIARINARLGPLRESV